MNNVQELNAFNHACDEFVTGKYILIDLKIASILSIIANDEKLTNIVNSCLQLHDFNTLASKYFIINTESKSFVMPETEKEIVSFVYNLLYHFKNKDIDFYKFAKTYFKPELSAEDLEDFSKLLIEPFKNSVNSIYSKRHVLIETSDYQNNYYNKIKSTVKMISKNIQDLKLNLNQKEELSMLLNSLYLASEKNDKKLVFSLMIGLDYFTKANKRAREFYYMIEECFNA